MDNNERDTHFQGFARILMQEVDEKNRAKAQSTGHYLDKEELHLLIAQRAYDLVKYATEHINKKAIYTEHPRFDAFMLAIVPDLTEWPKTASE